MPFKLYNTLSHEKEDFKPMNANEVRMYTCGPTVYNYAHIGNYRAYIFADTLKRSLLYSGFSVRHIMNLTDVDDKTIRDSMREGKTLLDFTQFYTERFYEDLESLNILAPERFTKATDNIDEMITLTAKLLDKGLAYKSEDGSIYFNIKKFNGYGKLSHLVLEDQKENAGGRIKSDEYEKDNVQDFALWKAWDENDGEVYWDTEFGRGRPGWHIECSAMSMKFLGEQLDIHTGGVDLIFPHHENEIAQSEGVTGKQFVKYWLHNEWLLVDGKKMSKSAGNFYTLRDIITKGIDPMAYRFWLLMASYRTRVNFVIDALEGAETALKRLYTLYKSLDEEMGNISTKHQQAFKEHLENDLDTPRALTVLWDLVKDENISNADKKATILDFDQVLGLGFANLKEVAEIIIPEEVQKLVDERELARIAKHFKKSDDLRDEIKALGYEVKDLPGGQTVSKI